MSGEKPLRVGGSCPWLGPCGSLRVPCGKGSIQEAQAQHGLSGWLALSHQAVLPQALRTQGHPREGDMGDGIPEANLACQPRTVGTPLQRAAVDLFVHLQQELRCGQGPGTGPL